MSTNKEQKLRKLTKRKIWRPIVFFVVSVLIAGIMVAACEGLYVAYLMESRFEEACENASEISGQIDDRLKRGESLKSIVTSVGLSASRVDALMVVDRQEIVLESFGENTANLDDVQIFEGREDYFIYEDIEAKKKILRLDGTVNLEMKDVASAFFKNPSIREDEKEWYYAELVKVAYWIEPGRQHR